MRPVGLALMLLGSLISCHSQQVSPQSPGNRANGAVLLPIAENNGNQVQPEGTPRLNIADLICRGNFGPTCLNCHTLLTCANGVINQQTCLSMGPSKPFCSGSACTSVPITNCNVPFRCTGKGIFPNPEDCSTYFFCTDASILGSSIFQCPTGWVYDSKQSMCKKRTIAADCKTISCTGYENKYQIITWDKSLLVYCADTPQTRETVIFRCLDWQNMEYDPDTNECQFVCKSEGRFADRLNCGKFYECYKSGNNLLFQHTTCPTGYRFDIGTKMCTEQPTGTCTSELS